MIKLFRQAGSPSSAAKQRQWLFAFGILAVITVAASIGVFLADSQTASHDPGPRANDITSTSYIKPGEDVNPQDAWRGASDARLANIEATLKKLRDENAELQRANGLQTKQAANTGEQMSQLELDRRLAEFESAAREQPQHSTPEKRAPQTPQPAQQISPQQAGQVSPQGKEQGPGIQVLHLRRSDSAATASTPRTIENYLPSGSFGAAVILSGLDAPTGGQSQQNPHPVLLQLRDPAVLPNFQKFNWNSCHITAHGYGDLSSERAMIRLESLSCVNDQGLVLDLPLQGYVAGEDGKYGVRGRLITKQGQALANGLLAGVVSGIGHGLERNSRQIITTPAGTLETTKEGEAYKAGIGEGIGRSLDRLANYYIGLAEKMFPVVEVDAGRVVDVVLLKGLSLDEDKK